MVIFGGTVLKKRVGVKGVLHALTAECARGEKRPDGVVFLYTNFQLPLSPVCVDEKSFPHKNSLSQSFLFDFSIHVLVIDHIFA